MTEPIVVHNHNHSGAMELGRIVATLLLCGSMVALAWALAQAGWLEMAAGAMTLYFVRLGGVLMQAGVLHSPGGGNEPVVGEKLTFTGLVAMAQAKYAETIASSSILRLAALPIPYVIAYMAAKEAVAWFLQVFTNVWVAGAAGGALASLIVAPRLLQSTFAQLRDRSGTPAPAPASPMAPTPPIRPTSHAPVPVAPTTTTAPTIVRLKKKENHDA